MSAPLPAAAIVDGAEENLLAKQAALREWLEATDPLGLERVSDEEFLVFFQQQMAAFPPETWDTPEGRVVTASPWVLMLSLVEGGDAWLKRVQRLQRRQVMALVGEWDAGLPDA